MNWALAAVAIGLMVGDEPLKMRVVDGDKEVGSASLTQKMLPDGSKQVAVTISLSGRDKKGARVRQESVYDAAGNPRRLLQEVLSQDGKRQRLLLATFDEEGAILTTQGEADAAKERRVALVKGAPRSNPSEFWFIKTQPKIGDRAVYYRFDLGSARWSLTETRYAGRVDAMVGPRKVKAHRVDSGYGSALFDEDGRPLLIESGPLRLERILDGSQ